MTVNREVQAPQDLLWCAFLGPASLNLCQGFPESRQKVVLGGGREYRQCVLGLCGS